MLKVGFIGFGNMAEAIIAGMISSGNYDSSEIGAFDPDSTKLNNGAKKYGIYAFSSNDELLNLCQCVVLAVKPIALQKVITPIKDEFCKANPLVISIAAGQSMSKLKSLLGYEAKLVRVMPNINAVAGKSVSGYTYIDNLTQADIDEALKILNSFGTAINIAEDDFSAYSAIAGCSPAYVYLLIDAVSRVGIKYGLTKKEALEIVSSSVIESVNSSNLSDDEINKVVLNAIEVAYKKDKGM